VISRAYKYIIFRLFLIFSLTTSTLKDSIYIRMWEDLTNEHPEILESPMELKIRFHCEILKNINQYELTFEEKMYFLGHPYFTGQENVMKNNDFLLGRDYDCDPNGSQLNSANELDQFWDTRPFSAAPNKIIVKDTIEESVDFCTEMPLFMRTIFTAVIK
jgi:hypothetical protein